MPSGVPGDSIRQAVLGVVPARGGSSGVPRKNLALVGNVPLVVRALRQAQGARLLAKTVVSTEDSEVASVCRKAGGEVPFLRPAELAGGDVPTLPVLLHALQEMERRDETAYSHVTILQPTSPLRRPEDIDYAVEMALRTGADSVVTVCATSHPAKIKRIENGRLVPYAVDEPEGAPRQALGPPAYRRNGAVYVIRRDVLVSGRLFGDDCRPIIMDPARSIDVDEPFDLLLADLLARRMEEGRDQT